jgi:hypothetical protein
MTARKHLKQLVRARMQKTGESYASARRHVLARAEQTPADPALRWHFPGNVPAITALRVLLAHAGLRDPHTGEPFSEATLFGLAGGIGVGVFSFLYEKEDFASFFVAGRHLWHDDLAYLRRACERLGADVEVREASGAKPAEQHLRAALDQGPCVAWVDAVALSHRCLPQALSAGGYHVVTVYKVEEEAGTALIGDLTDEPIPVPRPELARARGGIKKFKNRLLWVTSTATVTDPTAVVREGLHACHAGLTGEGAPRNARKNFSLEALRVWGERLHGSNDKERWERVFTPGHRLWRGLVSVYDFIENYGTGGGLCRPLFAEFLSGAADTLQKPVLRSLAERYADLGRAWSELAEAALPDSVPELRAVKDLHGRKAELTNSDGPAATDEVRACWAGLDEAKRRAKEAFPLSDDDSAALRADLQRRVRAVYEGETAAHQALGEAIAVL